MNLLPPLQTDFYKTLHYKMMPENMTRLYSNGTPRKSRIPGVNKFVFFGMQYFIFEYLITQWGEFLKNGSVIKEYKRIMDFTLGKDVVSMKQWEALRELGYFPLHIKALPEGALCPVGVPFYTITNTHEDFGWLVNYLETIMNCTIWQPIISATLAREYKKILTHYAILTTGNADMVQWQAHDFSMRGMSSLETACTSGAAHLTSFTGTDTIPAISFLEQYYCADVEKELIGASVPATEHSVMCMGTKDDELGTFHRLFDLFPTGILSIVSDTWDLWKVCTEHLPTLKEEILARDGKLVIRPDSGDPVNIICGDGPNEKSHHPGHPAYKGVIELLWEVFGGTVNEQGYKVLDPHIGAIYGDSITTDRAIEMCERLMAKGFASTNIILGVGSYTYQYVTRDTAGIATKATYGEVKTSRKVSPEITGNPNSATGIVIGEDIEGREIWKDPITDDGTKKSARGLLKVQELFKDGKHHTYVLLESQTWEQEKTGALETVFLDGKLVKFHTLQEIRNRINENLNL